MKKLLCLSTLALALTLGTGLHAQMGPGHEMVEEAGQQQAGSPSHQHPCMMAGGMDMMGPGMRHGMGPGMGPCGCGMGPAKMGGFGMGPGMMGCEMGCGMHAAMTGQVPPEKMQKFLDDTKDLRKRIHDLKFEYAEAMRNPKATVEQRAQMEKEMFELQDKLEEKAKQ